MITDVEKQRILAALHMEVLYDHEINCRISSFFDAGWTWSLGDESNSFIETGVADTFVDAVSDLWKSAGKHYPRFLDNVKK